MLSDLLVLAADQGKIVGMRIHPGEGAAFQVHIWVGPGMGERMEWSEEFDADQDRMTAVDAVAGQVVAACRYGDDIRTAESAFSWGKRVTAA